LNIITYNEFKKIGRTLGFDYWKTIKVSRLRRVAVESKKTSARSLQFQGHLQSGNFNGFLLQYRLLLKGNPL
jgi:hypothetical protein